jgi:hypothetical protein
MMKLPAEGTLNHSSAPISNAALHGTPTPSAPTPNPVANMSNLSLNRRSPAPAENPPPTYAQVPPPSLPRRQSEKPEIAQAVALYRYNDADPRDCDFEPGDRIAIYKYVNADWWEGRNTRTGDEGIFPQNYVRIENPPSQGFYGEKGTQQPQYVAQPYQQPAPNPYNSPVPPVAVANEPQTQEDGKGSKGAEMGKKFGKKLGNAAIFGAGATLGADLVNSIF